MNNPWLAGQIAKMFTKQRRTRRFWNIVFCASLLILFIVTFIFVYKMLCGHCVYEEEHIFIGYSDGFLVTDKCSYKIADENEQRIKISSLELNVSNGEKILLFVSILSGELVEVKYSDLTVYKIKVNQLAPSLFVIVVLFLPLIILNIFMLIVTNTRNPNKKIDRLQKKFLLR